MKKLIVFTGSSCQSCHAYIAKLKKHGIEFREISVDTFDGAMMAAKHHVRSLPTSVAVSGSSLPGNLPIETVRKLIK